MGTGGQRLVSMLEFCANALRSPHVTVSRLARHLFVALINVAMDVTYPMPIQRACQLISTLEPTLQARLRKMLQHPIPQSPVGDPGKRDGICLFEIYCQVALHLYILNLPFVLPGL